MNTRLQILIKSSSIFFLFLLVFAFLLTGSANASTKSYGWLWPHSSDGTVSCGSGKGKFKFHMHNEAGTPLGSGGSITANVSGTNFSGNNSLVTGCVNTDSNFYVSASYSGYQNFYSEFKFMSIIVSGAVNQIFHVNIFMTNTPTVEIIIPTGSTFTASPNFIIRTRTGPSNSVGFGSYNPPSCRTLYAKVNGQYSIIDTNGSFGDFTKNLNLPNGTHKIAFSYTGCSPWPVSALTGEKTITIGAPVTNRLNVNSSPTGITTTSTYPGTTNYSKTSSNTLSGRVDGPSSYSRNGIRYNFSSVSGCRNSNGTDTNNDRYCDVYVTGGATQNVNFAYTAAVTPTPTRTPTNTPTPSRTPTNTPTPTPIGPTGGTTTPTFTPTPGPTCSLKNRGDANCDGKINTLDFNIWRDEFISQDPDLADFDNNDSINTLDFNIWRDGFLDPSLPH